MENNSIEQAKAYLIQNSDLDNADKKLAQLKEKLKIFDGITSIAEARRLAKENFHITNDVNFINLENAKCVIVQSANLFRVCLEDDKEFICYNIARAKEPKGGKND